MRNQTGEVLLDLVSTALSLDSEGEALPGQRMDAINLERLIRLIKAPRPRTEMVSTRKRKNRMVTLLSAVRIVGKYCTNSLLNILHHKNHSSKEMLARVVEEEIRVLTALWHEHQQHLIRDRLHRHFTLACQRRAGVWLLIPAEDVKKGLEPLPEYKQLLQRLDDAVASVGGTVLTRVFRETKDDDEEHVPQSFKVASSKAPQGPAGALPTQASQGLKVASSKAPQGLPTQASQGLKVTSSKASQGPGGALLTQTSQGLKVASSKASQGTAGTLPTQASQGLKVTSSKASQGPGGALPTQTSQGLKVASSKASQGPVGTLPT
ncbi:hypothetical protein, conserved [Eimeria praecox]|uniref:Uncharacterized protein n=1 Tax=Eimeria praecox TaxID=51316 RepID=U6H3V8_9EIME|nr:hypothetical protein, conserved [Eimeria praecox]